MKGDLLWVYEGLTNYLGEVLAPRSGLWSSEDYRESLAETAAELDNKYGRTWRPLEDTAVDAQVLLQPRKGLGKGLEGEDRALRTEATGMHGEVAHSGAHVHDGPVRLDPGAPLVVAVETGLLQDPDFHPGRDAEAGAAVERDDERQRDRQTEEEPQDPAHRPHPEQDRRDGGQVIDPARRAPAARAPRRRHGFFAAATCTVPTALAAVSTT